MSLAPQNTPGGWPRVAWSAVLVTDGADPADSSRTGAVVVASVDDLVRFGDTIATDGVTWLVVAVPAALADRALPALTLTSFRWPHLRIAHLVSDHAPLALHAALTVAQAIVPDPGPAAGYLAAFTDRCWSGAWTPSVAALPTPGPSAGQYLRSLLPGSAFLVSFAPDPGIGSLRLLARTARRDGQSTLLVGEPGLPPSVATKVAAETGAAAVRPYAVPGNWRQSTGHARAVQLALVPSDPHTVRLDVVGVCGSCAQRVTSEVCPFCRIRVRESDRPPVPVGPALTGGA
jgi:hypothetical protein